MENLMKSFLFICINIFFVIIMIAGILLAIFTVFSLMLYPEGDQSMIVGVVVFFGISAMLYFGGEEGKRWNKKRFKKVRKKS